MVKKTQVTPILDEILAISQVEAEGALFGGENYRETAELVQKILKELGGIRDTEERRKKEKKLLQKVRGISTDFRKGQIFLALGNFAQEEGDKRSNFEIAKRRYERFLAQNKGDESEQDSVWKAYQNLGIAERALGNTEVARRNWEKVPEEAGETYFKACYSKIVLLLDDRNIEEAQRVLAHIDKKSPMYDMGLFAIGSFCFTHNIQLGIESYLGRVSENHPQYGNACYALGIHYFNNRKYSQSIDRIKKYTELQEGEIDKDKSYRLVIMLGFSYFEIGEYDKAIRFLNLIGDKQNLPKAQWMLGYIYHSKGDSQAIDCFKYYLRDESATKENSFYANYAIGDLLGANGGIEYLEKVTIEAGDVLYGKAQRVLGKIK